MRRLDWDTQFFGSAFALVSSVQVPDHVADRAAAFASLLREARQQAAGERFAHLTYRPPENDWQAIHGAERAGWLLVDLGVDFVKRGANYSAIDWGSRPSREEDLPALRELAATAFVYSRFAADPFFTSAQVQDFHRQWVTNLHNGLAQRVLVAETGGRVSGFVSCSVSRAGGRIPLIAVDERQRGRGLGRALLQAALDWFCDSGVDEVRVKTQANNLPAVQLYERLGFVIERTELTFTSDLRPMGNGEGRLQG